MTTFFADDSEISFNRFLTAFLVVFILAVVLDQIWNYLKFAKRACECHKSPIVVINRLPKNNKPLKRRRLISRRANKTNSAKRTTPIPTVDPKECPQTDPVNSQAAAERPTLSKIIENGYNLQPFSIDPFDIDIIEYPLDSENDQHEPIMIPYRTGSNKSRSTRNWFSNMCALKMFDFDVSYFKWNVFNKKF